MADELGGQIKAVEDKIAKVEGEIEKVTEQLELVAQLEDPVLREVRRAELQEEKKGLRTEVHDLRTKEEILLRAKYGAGCRSWPATTLCARTLVACLLSCHVP